MRTVKIQIENSKEFEIKVEEKDIETLVKIIKIFESGKINP